MPETWLQALNAYSYPVDLCLYDRKCEFPGFFELNIAGDRESTIMFENRFRQKAPEHVEAFYEVAFWKLYSFSHTIRNKGTDRIVNYVQNKNISAKRLWYLVGEVVQKQSLDNLKKLRVGLGINTNVLALALTFPSLASPETLPMIDKQVAKWVNANYAAHNIGRKNKLSPFQMNQEVVMQNDFLNYKKWVAWCREVADVLTALTDLQWRPRDVEMAVFTAKRREVKLNPL